MNTKKKVVIIGSGIGGLGTAALLSKRGYDVTIIEKNNTIGGRANIFTEQGYTFDMGPSWYLMPDVFEHFYDLMEEDINVWTVTKAGLCAMNVQTGFLIFISKFIIVNNRPR